MEYLIAIALLLGGFTILIIGGESLVKSAVSIACRFNVSPSIIGMTIVAAGTSAPELLTSLIASANGSPDIALGNVIGSNIFNILAILGAASLLNPNKVAKNIINFDIPILAGASILFYWMLFNGIFSSTEGYFSLGLLVLLIWASIKMSNRHRAKANASEDDDIEALKSPMHDVVFLIIGIGGLVGGAHIALQGGIQIGQLLGLSERIIGITIISIGTGLPELATSAVAAYRGRDDIAVSNVIGSNLMNTLAVAGGAATFKEIVVNDQILKVDVPIMLAATFVLIPLVFLGKHRIGRSSGAFLGSAYIAYLFWLIYS